MVRAVSRGTRTSRSLYEQGSAIADRPPLAFGPSPGQVRETAPAYSPLTSHSALRGRGKTPRALRVCCARVCEGGDLSFRRTLSLAQNPSRSRSAAPTTWSLKRAASRDCLDRAVTKLQAVVWELVPPREPCSSTMARI